LGVFVTNRFVQPVELIALSFPLRRMSSNATVFRDQPVRRLQPARNCAIAVSLATHLREFAKVLDSLRQLGRVSTRFSAIPVASHKQSQLLDVARTFQPFSGSNARRAVRETLAFHMMLDQSDGSRLDTQHPPARLRRQVDSFKGT
jgi:hypothetical protein